MLAVGDVLGSYTILAHLRSGGMADLFLAHRQGAAGFRRLVAVKVVHPRLAEDPRLARMFLDEALLTARVHHPNVVHVEDLGEVRGTYFLVMEYVHGCSLAQLMKVLGQLQRRLSPIVAVAIAARVAEGLHAAHETTDDDGALVGLVHRDVSPQNILLSHRGHVKLIDFGVAKARLRSQETQASMLKGKVRYMAPEQATTGEVDRRSDVYSLGIVLWEMLTMRRLFAGTTEFEVLMNVRDPQVRRPGAFVPGVPPELDDVVMACLAREPEGRPPTAKALRRMLAAALPRAMALDSAHLADLMASVVGEQLEASRHELPDEVSRVLGAEAVRAIEDEALDPSAVDSMTVHTDVAAFEEDELDDTPEVTNVVGASVGAEAPGDDAITAVQESITAVEEAATAAAFPRPSDMDEDPTMVGAVPADVGGALTERDDPTSETAIGDGSRPLTSPDAYTEEDITELPWSQPELPTRTADSRPRRPPWPWVAAIAGAVALGASIPLAIGLLGGEDESHGKATGARPAAPEAGAADAGPPEP